MSKKLTIFPVVIVDIFGKKSNMVFKHIESFELSPGRYQPTQTGKLQIELQKHFVKFINAASAAKATFVRTSNFTACYVGIKPMTEMDTDYACMISLSADCWFTLKHSQLQTIFTKPDSEFIYTPLSSTRYELRFTLDGQPLIDNINQPKVIQLLIPIADGKPMNITQTLKEAALVLWDIHLANIEKQLPADLNRYLDKFNSKG